MQTSDEIKHMIENLEGMNNEDVREAYGFDNVEEAGAVLADWFDMVLEEEINY